MSEALDLRLVVALRAAKLAFLLAHLDWHCPVTAKRWRERWRWPDGYTGQRDAAGQMVFAVHPPTIP